MPLWQSKKKRFLKFEGKEVIEVAYVITEECVACGTCSEECPVEAIVEGEPYVINEEKCTECGTCAEVCPVEAIVEK